MSGIIPEEEKTRRELFAGLVADGYIPPRPKHTAMYAPSGNSPLPYVRLPEDAKLPLLSSAKIAILTNRTKFQDGPSG
jgi:hypothetical protein